MKQYVRWMFVSAMLPVAACSSSAPPAPAPVAPPPPPPLAAVDQTFVNAAAASDAFEIQAGQLALTKGHSARVKKYANMMVSAHTQTTQQLTQIAQTHAMTPDPTLPPDEQKMLDTLNKVRPASFDRDYMRDNVISHRSAIKVYQDEIANGQDPDLKQFATATLPTVQQHYKLAGGVAKR